MGDNINMSHRPITPAFTREFPSAALSAPVDCQPIDWPSPQLDAAVAELALLFALQRELVRTQAAWMAGVPYWDAKQAIARHILEDAHHTEALLKRLHELKVRSAEHRQIAGVEELVRDLASAPHGDAWLRGLYTRIKPWLAERFAGYLAAHEPLMDQPSRDIIGPTVTRLRAQIAWFETYGPQHSAWETAHSDTWCEFVAARLPAAPHDPGQLATVATAPALPPDHPAFDGIRRIRRDRTFAATERGTFPREGATFAEKRFLVFYNHTQEMQFAESLGAILYETAEMPWAFHYDLARHLADEVRHATMGQTRLEQLGVALTELPMLTEHYDFRANLDPLERFCLMTLVMEATAFERKRANVDLFEQHGDPLSALYETYDIKDEMLHTHLGHTWVPVMLRVYHDARSVTELTEHCRAQIAQVINSYPSNAANMVKR